MSSISIALQRSLDGWRGTLFSDSRSMKRSGLRRNEIFSCFQTQKASSQLVWCKGDNSKRVSESHIPDSLENFKRTQIKESWYNAGEVVKLKSFQMWLTELFSETPFYSVFKFVLTLFLTVYCRKEKMSVNIAKIHHFLHQFHTDYLALDNPGTTLETHLGRWGVK